MFIKDLLVGDDVFVELGGQFYEGVVKVIDGNCALVDFRPGFFIHTIKITDSVDREWFFKQHNK